MRQISRRLLLWTCGLTALVVFAHLYATRRSFVIEWSNKQSDKQAIVVAEQIQEGSLAYAAGVYMAGRIPGNASSCGWSYGLPNSLVYSSRKLSWTPETGEKGPYRVLSGVVKGSPASGSPSLTLCTHSTADQVYGIVELARRWEGPISLAVFTSGLDAGLAVSLLDRACWCEPSMSKVSVHFVFPAGRPPALTPSNHFPGDCAASDLQPRESDTERKSRNLVYPVNVARNVARTQAITARVLVSDIELLPSDNLASGFIEMVRNRAPRVGVVFVIPVFEIEANEKPPNTKHELLMSARAGVAGYFHRFICPHCQKFPGLSRWMLAPDPGRVRPFVVTRREFPQHRWEPIYIGTRDDPLYTEDMSWEGKQDKMAQMLELCLLSYRLVVLDGAFLVHVPGVKRRASNIDNRSEAWRRPHERRNSRVYQSVVKRLLKQYPSNTRCQQVDEETRDFFSVYKKDYHPKRTKRPRPHVQPSEYPFPLNPLNGPFKELIYTTRKNLNLESTEQSEDVQTNLERIKLNHPNLRKVLPDCSPNEDLIELRDKKITKTVYQLDYSKDLDDYLSLTARRTGGDRPRVSLPEGWVIPETVQKISYRNPRELARELATILPKKSKPFDNLVPKDKERAILGVRTGESNYGATISALGGKIVDEHMYGMPYPLDPPVPHVKGPDSVRSDCSITLMRRKYNNFSNVF